MRPLLPADLIQAEQTRFAIVVLGARIARLPGRLAGPDPIKVVGRTVCAEDAFAGRAGTKKLTDARGVEYRRINWSTNQNNPELALGRKRLAAERRSQILEALRRCICRYGLQRATIKRIAAEAGLPAGLLHHYFRGRSEMIEVLVRRTVDDLAASYHAHLEACRAPARRLDRALGFLFGPKVLDLANARFFYECWAETTRNPVAREAFANLYRRSRETIVRLLNETGMASGLAPADVRDLASLLIAIQDGVALQCDMDPAHVSAARMRRLTRRVLLRYVMAAKPACRRKEGARVGRRGLSRVKSSST